MGYRFHTRQKTYSIGLYGNGKDGTFSLADARRERDKAKDLFKKGKDPSTEKQLGEHRQAAARPFEQWADEWLAKKKVEKVKRGRIVAVRDPKTIEVLELRVGYVKDRFGKLLRQDIKRPDVLAFMRSYEAEGKLETRDRVRSIGEQIRANLQLCRCRRRRLQSIPQPEWADDCQHFDAASRRYRTTRGDARLQAHQRTVDESEVQ
jgi:hypothetical protein